MNILKKPLLTIVALFLLSTALAACAAGTGLQTPSAVEADASGTYRLYLYGCRYAHDVENYALLVDEQTTLQVDLYVPATSYKVKEHLSGADALREARTFFRCSTYDRGKTVMRRISANDGRILGFELKPLYEATDLGRDEALRSSYFQSGGRVTVYLKLDPQVERFLYHTSPNDSGGK